MSSEQTQWTSRELLNWMRNRFEASGVDAPRVVAETLLAEAFGCTRLDLHMHPDRPADSDDRDRLREYVRRILTGEPLHYVTGQARFWHGSFSVRPCTQIPQPCTELLVSHTLGLLSTRGQKAGHGRKAADSLSAHDEESELPGPAGCQPAPSQSVLHASDPESVEQAPASPVQDGPIRILELGVGSGAVIVSLLQSLPDAIGVAVDVEDACLNLSQDNAKAHGVGDRLTLQLHDARNPFAGDFDVVVGNLPYIPDHEWPHSVDSGVLGFTPEKALRGGEDGLVIIRPMARWVGESMRPDGILGLEHAACSSDAVRQLLTQLGFYDVETLLDEDGFERATFGLWSGKSTPREC